MSLAFELAGGSLIFLIFVVLFILAVAYGYYTRTGSGINQHGWSDRDRAIGTGIGKDASQTVADWGRGSSTSPRRRRMTALEQQTAEAIDGSAGAERDPAWRGRVGASVQLVVPVDPAVDHVRGPNDAEVTLVEYGEYECPYCKEAEVAVAEIEERFGDALRVVWRHFPQRGVHPNAFGAAVAAEAAGRQGRFWDMHRLLATARDPLDEKTVTRAAKEIGLDLDRFAADRADPALADAVRQAAETGVASGVNGTPTFFINNVRYDDDFNAEELGAAIDAARGVAARAGAGGVS